MPFDGETYDPDRDRERLESQMRVVKSFMLEHEGQFFSSKYLERELCFNWASISARLRDLRKRKFGSYCVMRKYIDQGLFAYAVIGRDKL